MPHSVHSSLSRTRILWLVTASGFAALSWEVIWQIKSSLALGVSAWGTALTLAVTMGGMGAGALAMGHWLKAKHTLNPMRLYAALELIVGFAGLCLGAGFHVLENIDTQVYAVAPQSASLVHILGIAAVLGVPAFCMGATLPVFGMVAKQFHASIALLYGLNTLGAAGGALLMAFSLIPEFGITHSSFAVAGLNMAVAIAAWLLSGDKKVAFDASHKAQTGSRISPAMEYPVVIVTGFSTFLLEVAWFRSLTAAFRSTTDAFAIMLASVLISLGLGASLVPVLRKRKLSPGSLIGWAGILILLVTPIIERFDHLMPIFTKPTSLALSWFMMTFYVIGPPVMLLGMALPWILDAQSTPKRWGTVYALNTLAAIAGSIGAAWVFLPLIGFARTAWIAGVLIVIVGLLTVPRQKRLLIGAVGLAALLTAGVFETGVGRVRAQGILGYNSHEPTKVLEAFEGPEATASAIEYDNGWRALVIDGFVAASQFGASIESHSHYMPWMGHLPMLLDGNPRNALVICFGTGQTANAVRNENPQSLDIVDVNPRVFKLAHNFTLNQNVLSDPRVHPIVMDGRAYMRRTPKTYDVITLEPMPPTFAGVNSLYDREFYQLARKRLAPDGVIAQWIPFHLMAPHYTLSVIKTFMEVFPNAMLWDDPGSKTGILVGSADDSDTLGVTWPGFDRAGKGRDLTEGQVRNAVLLDREQLAKYAVSGEIITDDNQLLAYGPAVYSSRLNGDLAQKNFDLMEKLTGHMPQ